MPRDQLSLYQKWAPGASPLGQRQQVHRPDKLTAFMSRNSECLILQEPSGSVQPCIGVAIILLKLYVQLMMAICL